MRKSTINLILSVLFVILTIIFTYSSWNSAKEGVTTSQVGSVVTASDLSSIKNQADQLILDLENNADLPVIVPTSKLSKTNPFAPGE